MLTNYRTRTALILLVALMAIQPAWARRAKGTGQPDFVKGEMVENTEEFWNIGPSGIVGYFWSRMTTTQILVKEVEEGSPAEGKIKAGDVLVGLGDGRFVNARDELIDAVMKAENTKAGGTITFNVWRPSNPSIPSTDSEPAGSSFSQGSGGEAGQDNPEGSEQDSAEGSKQYIPGESEEDTPASTKQAPSPSSRLRQGSGGQAGQDIPEGKYMKVTLTVPFMGVYSATSPWNCPKTDAIIEKAVQHIINSGLGEEQIKGQERQPITEDLNALGLLATGDKKHLPLIRNYAHKIAGPDILYARGGKTASSWHAGYRNIFLTEYYLITKDEHVLPTIRSLSEYIALGVSGVGTWSHGMARKTYGPPAAYGAMNNCSITCALSLVLAQKCGVNSPAIDKAITMNNSFLNWVIDKGTITYGDDGAKTDAHDSNGRNSQAAVLYDLYGKKKGAEFLTRMSIASFPQRDYGHTGHFFSSVWGNLGAARGGDDAAKAFMQNTRYYTELERRFNGSYVYQGGGVYRNWDATGARLISLCLPRKALYINGKGSTTVRPIVGDELKDVLNSATFAEGQYSILEYTPPKLSVEELLQALGSWSPVVRAQAAMELGKRKEDVVDKLLAKLESANDYERYGACAALTYAGRGSEKAAQMLVDILKDSKSLNMRYYATQALLPIDTKKFPNGLGNAANKARPALLKLAASGDMSEDPNSKLKQCVVNAFFSDKGVRGNGFAGMPPEDLVAAMKAWLSSPNGGTRTEAVKAYEVLSDDQLEQLWPSIYMAANESPLSGVMYGGQGKQRSVGLMASHKFKEAIPMAVMDMLQDGWGAYARVPSAFGVLSKFGSAVKPYMAFVDFRYEEFMNRGGGEAKAVSKAYPALTNNLSKDVELKSIKPYLQAAGIPYKKPDVAEELKNKARMYFGWEVVGLPAVALAKEGKTSLEDRTWHYTTVNPKPGKTYETLSVFCDIPFKDVAAGEGLADWFKPDFDVSAWKTGHAPIGKEPWRAKDKEIAARTQWDNDDTYLLMRTTFETDPERYEKYRFHIVDTVGIRVYLNGQEVFTPKYYWTKKPSYRVIEDKVSGVIKKGTNTLAIYACNPGKGPVMVDCIIKGLLKEENFDPTPYYKEEE